MLEISSLHLITPWQYKTILNTSVGIHIHQRAVGKLSLYTHL